jgi:hypothetical protein
MLAAVRNKLVFAGSPNSFADGDFAPLRIV